MRIKDLILSVVGPRHIPCLETFRDEVVPTIEVRRK
jgi:hypothetical protein